MDPQQLSDVKRALGRLLAEWRSRRGLTQDDVARLVHSTRSTVANVERGRQVVDRVFWAQCESLLRADGRLISGYDEYRSLEVRYQQEKAEAARRARWGAVVDPQVIAEANVLARAQDRGRPVVPVVEVVGGAVVGGAVDGAYVGLQRAIMSAARETSEHAMNAGAKAVSDHSVEQLRDDVVALAQGFGLLTPAAAVSETLRVRALAAEALQRTGRPHQQQELYLVIAQAAALLASASADLSLWTSAMQYARAADTYGEIIGHAGVRAYARGMQATVAYWTGRYDDAVRYASAAVEIAPPGIARVRAHSVLARAWAYRGATDRVREALTAADVARSLEGSDVLHDVIGGEFGFTASQQARCASTAWLQANSPQEATVAAMAALRLAAGQEATPWSTVEGESRVDLATCQLFDGRLDAAQETLAPLWSIPPEWRRTGLLGRLERVQQLLSSTRWHHVPEARQLADQANSFTAARPAPPALPSA